MLILVYVYFRLRMVHLFYLFIIKSHTKCMTDRHTVRTTEIGV